MGTIVHVKSELTAGPLPANGAVTLSDDAKVRMEFEIDLSAGIGRATVTGNWLLLAVAMRRAVMTLLADLAPRFAKAAVALRSEQPAGTVQ